MAEEIEACRFCGKPITPKGRRIFKGREVNIVGCKNCGIDEMVSAKDEPIMDTAFRCAPNQECDQNAGGWCRLNSPCENFKKPVLSENTQPK